MSAATSGEECYRAYFDKKPLWVASAVLSQDNTRLFLTDPSPSRASRGTLLSYDLSGNNQGVDKAVFKAGDSTLIPTKISKEASGDLLVASTDGTILSIDGNLRQKRREFNALEGKLSRGVQNGSMYQFTSAGDYLVAYGALVNLNNELNLGFFRTAIHGDTSRLDKLGLSADPAYYLLGYPYLASLSGEAYFVLMSNNDSLGIYKVSAQGSPEKLKVFPSGFSYPPSFKTKMTGPKSAAAHFSELETFTVPAALYAHNNLLYLLTRTPDHAGGIIWQMYPIDPHQNKILDPIRLPTSSPEITVVPSDETWVVIERDRVADGQSQDIKSMLVIPSALINNMSLPASCLTK